MRKVISILVAMILVLGIMTSAMAENVEMTSDAAPVQGGTLTYSGYFDPPPAVNGNPMTPSGDYEAVEFTYSHLFEYAPVPEPTYIPYLGESWEVDGNNIVVKLREGLKWSDGSDLTAKDVWATYMMKYLDNDMIWEYMDDIEVVDDTTIVFKFHQYSNILPVMLFDQRIQMDYETYGKWADQAAELYPQHTWNEEDGCFENTEEVDAKISDILVDVYEWLPDVTTVKFNGGFTVTSVNASEMMLTKNPLFWNADKVYFDNLCIQRYVSMEAFLSNVMQGVYDIENHGLAPDVNEQLLASVPNVKIMWSPSNAQPVFQFNCAKYPMNIKEVRQAMSWISDRVTMEAVMEPGIICGDLYQTGLPTGWRDAYMTDEVRAKCVDYSHNPDKATEALESIGWKIGDSGYWENENGEVVEIEVSCMSGWPHNFNTSELFSLQLEAFGFKTVFKPMELSAYWDYLDNGDYMIGSQNRGGSTFNGPWEAYNDIYNNGYDEQGYSDDMFVLDGEQVNVSKCLSTILYGTEEEAADAVHTLMEMTSQNCLLFTVGLKTTPQRIYNDSLVYPTDIEHWAWYGGGIRCWNKLLTSGLLYTTVAE